jgi:hypothetical protein
MGKKEKLRRKEKEGGFCTEILGGISDIAC